ncbi:unnamed protein product, partial [Symbiodinium pilosum]
DSLTLLQHSMGLNKISPSLPSAALMVQRQVEGADMMAPHTTEGTCLANDVQAILSGLKDADQTLSWGVGLPTLALFLLGITVLLVGHRLVTPVVIVTAILAAFYFSFELLRASFSTSCAMPVYVAIVLGAIAGCAAFFFLEIAIVVPGAVLGVVLAYQVQVILMSTSPHLRQSPILVKYYWAIAAASALVFAFIAHKMREDIFILVTSVLGSFAVSIASRGLLLDYFHVRMTDLAELLLMVGLLILGMVYQHKTHKQE